MRQVPADTESNCISLLQNGASCREISRNLGISKSAVSKISKRNSIEREPNLGGGTSKITPKLRRLVARKVAKGVLPNAVSAQKYLNVEFGIEIGANAVRTALKREGLVAMKKVDKPRLSQKHAKERLRFAKNYVNWTIADWDKVVFSDETKINRFGSDGARWAYKKAGMPIASPQINKTTQGGGGSLMLWGCMMSKGVGYSCRLNGCLDSDLYCQILKGELLDTLSWYQMNIYDIWYQQDNAPAHTSRATKEVFRELGLAVLDWPSNSPDLNPIEHMWVHLKRQLNKYPNEPEGVNELWERVELEWGKITAETCRTLIHSMPDRLAAVIKAKGKYTKY
jgi:transposase